MNENKLSDLSERIVNPGKEDFHVHSIVFSDGFNTIDELVQMAGKVGIGKIALTDHCQFYQEKNKIGKRSYRSNAKRWKNVHNDVEIIFGVEADIINENGDISMDIQGLESDFTILATHKSVYSGDPEKINEAYENAIRRYADKLKFVAHPCAKYFEKTVNIDRIIDSANQYGLPLEFNCCDFVNNRANKENVKKMLERGNKIIVNSDAHMLVELRDYRQIGLDYLRDNYFAKKTEKLGEIKASELSEVGVQ